MGCLSVLGRVRRLLLFEGAITLYDGTSIPVEELPRSTLPRVYFDEERFEVTTVLVAKFVMARFTKILELLLVSIPPIALFIVFTSVRTGYRSATRRTYHAFATPTVWTPHGQSDGGDPLSPYPVAVRIDNTTGAYGEKSYSSSPTWWRESITFPESPRKFSPSTRARPIARAFS